MPNGIIDFIKRVQSVEKTTYQVIAIIHDRDIKLDVHDLYAEARLKPHIHIIVRCTDCSQRDPDNWKVMILNDEVSANSIMKRATKHYTIKINTNKW